MKVVILFGFEVLYPLAGSSGASGNISTSLNLDIKKEAGLPGL